MSKTKRFRSIADLQAYTDPEPPGFREPSMTDPSDHEPIERLVGRMVRGEIRGGSPVEAYDGFLDTPEAVEEAMANQPVYERAGFDLADAAAVLHEGDKALRTLRASGKAKEKRSESKGAAGEAPAPQGKAPKAGDLPEAA